MKHLASIHTTHSASSSTSEPLQALWSSSGTLARPLFPEECPHMTMPKCREPHLSDREEGIEKESPSLLLMKSWKSSLLGRSIGLEGGRVPREWQNSFFFSLRKISS